ncbi:MAG TPA: IS110 family transposase [Hyphomicrobiales bacterium]|nr:IS110 family transposase [Hyphomicrobiales bacterium]
MHETIGIDVSKDTIDVHRLSDAQHARFGNDKAGLAALRRWIGKSPVRIVYEATGRYHRDLERALDAAGHALVKVNPGRARRFAQAVGHGAKTDRVDAAMLARMGAVLELDAKPARTDSMHEIRELHIARVALIKDRTACRNRLHGARNKVVLAQLRARLRQVEKQIKQIDAELLHLVAADPGLARRFDILMSVPGIGPVAAVAMIVEMPELGTMNGKEAASLAGLAPVTRESGKWKGKARIGGGRAGLRTMLYMPAIVATRFNRQLGQTYQTLCDAGKPAKVAITAVMRKLLILANALIRDDRKWADSTP